MVSSFKLPCFSPSPTLEGPDPSPDLPPRSRHSATHREIDDSPLPKKPGHLRTARNICRRYLNKNREWYLKQRGDGPATATNATNAPSPPPVIDFGKVEFGQFEMGRADRVGISGHTRRRRLATQNRTLERSRSLSQDGREHKIGTAFSVGEIHAQKPPKALNAIGQPTLQPRLFAPETTQTNQRKDKGVKIDRTPSLKAESMTSPATSGSEPQPPIEPHNPLVMPSSTLGWNPFDTPPDSPRISAENQASTSASQPHGKKKGGLHWEPQDPPPPPSRWLPQALPNISAISAIWNMPGKSTEPDLEADRAEATPPPPWPATTADWLGDHVSKASEMLKPIQSALRSNGWSVYESLLGSSKRTAPDESAQALPEDHDVGPSASRRVNLLPRWNTDVTPDPDAIPQRTLFGKLTHKTGVVLAHAARQVIATGSATMLREVIGKYTTKLLADKSGISATLAWGTVALTLQAELNRERRMQRDPDEAARGKHSLSQEQWDNLPEEKREEYRQETLASSRQVTTSHVWASASIAILATISAVIPGAKIGAVVLPGASALFAQLFKQWPGIMWRDAVQATFTAVESRKASELPAMAPQRFRTAAATYAGALALLSAAQDALMPIALGGVDSETKKIFIDSAIRSANAAGGEFIDDLQITHHEACDAGSEQKVKLDFRGIDKNRRDYSRLADHAVVRIGANDITGAVLTFLSMLTGQLPANWARASQVFNSVGLGAFIHMIYQPIGSTFAAAGLVRESVRPKSIDDNYSTATTNGFSVAKYKHEA